MVWCQSALFRLLWWEEQKLVVEHGVPDSDVLYSKLCHGSMVNLAFHPLEVVILIARYCLGLGGWWTLSIKRLVIFLFIHSLEYWKLLYFLFYSFEVLPVFMWWIVKSSVSSNLTVTAKYCCPNFFEFGFVEIMSKRGSPIYLLLVLCVVHSMWSDLSSQKNFKN